jgi:hypothetical protein
MIRLHLTLAGHRFNFGSGALLALAAAIGVVVLFSAYVDALHHSVERGEILRQAQRADAGVRRDAVRYDPDLTLRGVPRVATLSR